MWGEGGGRERERERESGAGRGSTRQSRVKKRESATACQAIIGAASATMLGKTSERERDGAERIWIFPTA